MDPRFLFAIFLSVGMYQKCSSKIWMYSSEVCCTQLTSNPSRERADRKGLGRRTSKIDIGSSTISSPSQFIRAFSTSASVTKKIDSWSFFSGMLGSRPNLWHQTNLHNGLDIGGRRHMIQGREHFFVWSVGATPLRRNRREVLGGGRLGAEGNWVSPAISDFLCPFAFIMFRLHHLQTALLEISRSTLTLWMAWSI